MTDAELQRITDTLERKLGRQWIAVMDWLQSQNDVAGIEARLAVGDIDGLVTDLRAATLRYTAEIHDAYITAGRAGAEWLNGEVSDKIIRFDITNRTAVARNEANALEYVREIDNEQRAVIRNILTDGSREGLNPRAMAQDIKRGIGLTESQEQAVRSYRRALESGDFQNAMGRELRDRRGDRTLRAASRTVDPLPLTQGKIDSLTERYRTNFVVHRAETIGRTEALRAANDGAQDSIKQAIDRGDVDPADLIKTWNSPPLTSRSRRDHFKMDGVHVPVLEAFTLPDGTRMSHPGDPAGGAENVINCRCTASTTYGRRADHPRAIR